MWDAIFYYLLRRASRWVSNFSDSSIKFALLFKGDTGGKRIKTYQGVSLGG